MPPLSVMSRCFALLVCVACTAGSDAKSVRRGESASAVIDATPRSGTWSDADEKSTWIATRIVANALRIDETATFGADSRASRMFLFDSAGHLISMSDTREQTVQSGNSSPITLRSLLVIEFANDSATRTSKQVDGAERPVQSYEIDNARRHAQQLLTLARQAVPRP